MRLVHVPANQPKSKGKPFYLKRRVWFLVLASLLVATNYLRPLPPAQVEVSLPELPAPVPVELNWPEFGQAALVADGYGELGTSGSITPLATASIAKVITALCVLEKHPIPAGSQGESIQFSSQDVLLYREQISQNGSRLPVYDGQRMSQYEALQAVMVPSANNIADSLAIWAFGSLDSYAKYANSYLLRHGLVNTRVGTDASGLDPSTRSTAEDLARLGLIATKNRTLMEIAGQKFVSFSYGGDYDNYNRALGTHGITGLKTGNNDENPGALLFTAVSPSGPSIKTLSGAVMGASDLSTAIAAAQRLVESASDDFEQIVYVEKGDIVGELRTAWGEKSMLVAERDMILDRWRARPITTKVVQTAGDGTSNSSIARVEAFSDTSRATSGIQSKTNVNGPSAWWRLTHIR